ncbi:hypothetical protein Pmar_PMAR006402 [Perkinsus marinus ATCC 50983]|uniref:Uncharacterized protein n=1 Tax=Perkinsus marinus (strain ATCC 50983 / TXsc) TaxID=423536 RepID=C5K9L0_PERM5|nr:hypothetical protein Pmar_PMAR006402 [Perkinsus marinus ATCC 50983]EER18782.1 hypothetical protein Pmar_PMAR006402 [Perkinsus marinus ATCC 50983]|eukprot:XP_002786986.1 hypothetical protein Pmar_PMAR006402 [Perkinsus marinus ATCC 50983]
MASISATVKACPVMASLLGLALGSYFLQWLMRIVKPRVAAVKDELTFEPAPLFGRFQVWRVFTYPLVHPNFASLMVSTIHLLFSLDLESTPNIDLPGGANLRCGTAAISAGFCYPLCGIGHISVGRVVWPTKGQLDHRIWRSIDRMLCC